MATQADIDYARIKNFHKKDNLGRQLNVGFFGGGSEDAFFGGAAWMPVLKMSGSCETLSRNR